MPKNSKSSASSATRKKKSQKAAANKEANDANSNGTKKSQPPPQRGQKKVKGKNKEPRKKVFIPPVKPKGDVVDPLDSLGLANLLPSDLVILLRKAGKKDVVTRSRALEGLIDWIQNDAIREDEDEKWSSLVMAIPSWAQLFPRLSISPNRRLRQLTSQCNSLLLSNRTYLNELSYQPEHLDSIIGGMFILAFDPDRLTSRSSKVTWEQHTTWGVMEGKLNLHDHLEFLLSHITAIVYHQSDESVSEATKMTLNSSRDAKNRDDSNVEEDIEGIDARLVHCALGALGWLIVAQPKENIEEAIVLYTPLMTSSVLWTCLSQKQIPHQSRSLGTLSPLVRLAAWNLVRILAQSWKELLDKTLDVMAYTALRSAFDESDLSVAAHMREGLITLLRERQHIWKVNESKENDDSDESSEDSEDDDEDVEGRSGSDDEIEMVENQKAKYSPPLNGKVASTDLPKYPLYLMFLQWLSKGLQGIHSNYSIIIVVLSTLPELVFPPSSKAALEMLNAMYQPIDEREMEGREALRHFFSALMECLVWSSARINKLIDYREATPVVSEMTKLLFNDFIGTIFTIDLPELQGRTASLGEDRLRAESAALLRKLGNVDITLGLIMLDQISSILGQSTLNGARLLMERNLDILRLASTSSQSTPVSKLSQDAIYQEIRDICKTTANVVASGETEIEGVHFLTALMIKLPDALDTETITCLEYVFNRLQLDVNSNSSHQMAAFYTSYLACIQDESNRTKAWRQVLDNLCKGNKINWNLLSALIESMKAKDDFVTVHESTNLEETIQQHYQENIAVVRNLLQRPQPFIREETSVALMETIASQKEVYSLNVLLSWLRGNLLNISKLFKQQSLLALIPAVVTSALLHVDETAQQIWTMIQREPKAKSIAVDTLGKQLQLLDEPLPKVISALRMLTSSTDLMSSLPGKDEFLQLFQSACEINPPTAVIIQDYLAEFSGGSQGLVQYDQAGLSSYCRCTFALLEIIEDTGIKAAWILPHLISLAIAAEDAAISPLGGKSHFSHEFNSTSTISRAIRAATGILSSLSRELDEVWFQKAANGLKSSFIREDQDDFTSMLVNVWNTPRSARVLSRLFKGLVNFSGVSERECLHFLRLGQAIQYTNSTNARAIYTSIKDVVIESPLYDRIRNELAARLADVPPSKASTEGMKLLSLLISIAPPAESSIALVPQQRSIFLLQSLQKWIASDDADDYPPQLNALLMQILSHLLPIIQDMPGSHLAFMCDMMDINLSEGMENPACVYHSLVLVEQFSTLAERNAMLREVWNESKVDIYKNIHDLFLDQDFSNEEAGARVSAVYAALVDVVRSTPESLFLSEEDTIPLLNLMKMGSAQIQILAYRLISHSIREKVKDLVVEIATGMQTNLNSEKEGEEKTTTLTSAKVDINLIDMLRQPRQDNDTDDFAFVLSWLALFDYFEESSLQVKSMYTSQIQNLALVENNLIPFLFSILDNRFDPSKWSLEEVYIDELESSEQQVLQVFTAHVFYRSLVHIPNLIRESFNGLKDRQESLYLRSFIMRHLTPLLAHREFNHLRDESILDRLIDESMAIKVLAGSNEVIATYTIDEYPLEISIIMPNDYPLRNVEIKDLKKIGVSEGTWRAWILSIRQLIGSRNGLIFDALMLFKRNVEAKFSGFDEDSTCAVCYSIVSPTDHSLPTKPCKTCKKKFHASCLYKWVSTSGSSTCPLCRSIL